MNGDRGEGFEGDFRTMPQNQRLLADCNVCFPDRTRPRDRIRESSDDEAVVISANEMEVDAARANEWVESLSRRAS